MAGKADRPDCDCGSGASLSAGTDEIQEPRGAGITYDGALAGKAVGRAGLAFRASVEGANRTVKGAASIVGQVPRSTNSAKRSRACRAAISAKDA